MAAKDRKKQLARQRYERQEQRRAQAAAKARRLKIIGSAAAVGAIVVGGAAIVAFTGKDDESDAAAKASAAPQPKPGECAYKEASAPGAPEDLGTPPVKPVHKGTVKATVETNRGDVVMQLDGKKAPCTVNSFAFLAEKNFYDKIDCHRLTSGGLNVLQCGDPTGEGAGGPGYQFANENTEGAKYTAGTLAMAHSQLPDSNGSQFFLVYEDSDLPPDYTVFGKITKGLDVVKEIAKAGSEPKQDGKPKKKVTIQDVSIAGK
ncbi:peptidylprolyl isomerase [Actinomadura sp. 7K507]|uniref:peptidylprolyl isomerase n=1 Tax=Actinomadura sp. 7K507 TaxID=2530365 RepID=UPI001051445D|nr:peptidylprolyl isomerase [Actinomadura sp. 7K507]TDC96494.1 peptidylprolyl isomerase [Actinomadura sp. 7K507]